jgi:hypothetical protein
MIAPGAGVRVYLACGVTENGGGKVGHGSGGVIPLRAAQ